ALEMSSSMSVDWMRSPMSAMGRKRSWLEWVESACSPAIALDADRLRFSWLAPASQCGPEHNPGCTEYHANDEPTKHFKRHGFHQESSRKYGRHAANRHS